MAVFGFNMWSLAFVVLAFLAMYSEAWLFRSRTEGWGSRQEVAGDRLAQSARQLSDSIAKATDAINERRAIRRQQRNRNRAYGAPRVTPTFNNYAVPQGQPLGIEDHIAARPAQHQPSSVYSYATASPEAPTVAVVPVQNSPAGLYKVPEGQPLGVGQY